MVRVFYGFNGAGSEWSEAIQLVMIDLGFQPCMYGSDVWMISAVETSAIDSSDD